MLNFPTLACYNIAISVFNILRPLQKYGKYALLLNQSKHSYFCVLMIKYLIVHAQSQSVAETTKCFVTFENSTFMACTNKFCEPFYNRNVNF